MAEMVAEMVSSVVAQETCSQILSGMVNMYREKEDSAANTSLERLEMAHIRLEAALETSENWYIIDSSLLRWRRKLKRAAQECDDTLQKCKKRILENEQMEQEVRNSSLPNRIAHATKSFVFSVFNRKNNELSRSVVQRFEWFANGTSDFLRFMELGGTPWRHMPFFSLVENLFAGKELHYKTIQGGDCPLFQLWLAPFRTAETGTEASLIFIQKDGKSNIFFKMIIQLSESTDIVGIAIKCLEMFAPHFKYTTENIRKELAQLPTRYLPWVPSVYQTKDRDILHGLGSQWYRPNPLCCKQHDQHEEVRCVTNLDTAGLTDVSLEPVIEVSLGCQVSLPLYNKQKTSPSEDIIFLQDSPYVNAAISFTPHRILEGMLPANRSSAIEMIVGKEKHCLHTDITLDQLEEIVLPKAIDFFNQNVKATVYQMLWKSNHGSALIQVDRTDYSTRRTSLRTQRSFGRSKKRNMLQREDQELRTRMMSRLLELWRAQTPVQLRRSLMDWVRKEKECQLITPHLYLPL
ncbi:unnamed protein product [Urochloa decumbens]|uniref:Uncharacterized protein n=1 Tax=Urochloa decumbens TaxID=240449 RepID=A0ABC9GBR3_9POAL